MSRRGSFGTTFLVLVLLGVVGSFLLKGKEPYEYHTLSYHPDAVRPVPQTRSEQIVPEPLSGETLLVPRGEDQELIHPITLRVSPTGELLVLDTGAKRVKVFDQHGNLLRTLAEPTPDLPPLVVPTDLKVTPDGNVWVVDQGSRTVLVFSPEGDLLRRHRLEYDPARVAPLSRGGFATVGYTTSEALLSIHDRDGRRVAKFGTFVEDQDRYEVALDGWLESDSAGTIYYAPARVGFFGAYGADGQLNYLRNTLGAEPFPQIRLIRDGRVGVDLNTPWTTMDLRVDGETLHVLRYLSRDQRQRSGVEGVVDVYDASSGEYERSFTLPTPAQELERVGDSVFALTSEGLVRWDVNREEVL